VVTAEKMGIEERMT